MPRSSQLFWTYIRCLIILPSNCGSGECVLLWSLNFYRCCDEVNLDLSVSLIWLLLPLYCLPAWLYRQQQQLLMEKVAGTRSLNLLRLGSVAGRRAWMVVLHPGTGIQYVQCQDEAAPRAGNPDSGRYYSSVPIVFSCGFVGINLLHRSYFWLLLPVAWDDGLRLECILASCCVLDWDDGLILECILAMD